MAYEIITLRMAWGEVELYPSVYNFKNLAVTLSIITLTNIIIRYSWFQPLTFVD